MYKIYFAPVPFVKSGALNEPEAAAFFAREFGRRFRTVSLIKSSAKHPPTGVIELDDPVLAEIYLSSRPILDYQGTRILLSRKFSEVVYRIPSKDQPTQTSMRLFTFKGYTYHIFEPRDNENYFSKTAGWTQFKLSSPEVTVPFNFQELSSTIEDYDDRSLSILSGTSVEDLIEKVNSLRTKLTSAIFDALEEAHFPLFPFRNEKTKPLITVVLKLDDEGHIDHSAKVYFHVSYELLAFTCADAFRNLGSFRNGEVQIEIPPERAASTAQPQPHRMIPVPPKPTHSPSPYSAASTFFYTAPPRGAPVRTTTSLSPPCNTTSPPFMASSYYYPPKTE